MPESLRSVSGIVPSRAVRVSVNVAGAVTCAADGVDRPTRRLSTCARRGRRSAPSAMATSRWRASGSSVGLSPPTSPLKVSRSARASSIARPSSAPMDSGVAGRRARSTALPPASSKRASVVEGLVRASWARTGDRHRAPRAAAGRPRRASTARAGAPRCGPRSAARGAGAPARPGHGWPPGQATPRWPAARARSGRWRAPRVGIDVPSPVGVPSGGVSTKGWASE